MNDKKAIQHLHDMLKHKSRWYIDVSCPDDREFQDIAEKAKDNADYILTDMSSTAMYQRYKRWRKSDPIIGKDEDYFRGFLNDLVYQLGRSSLEGNELTLFEYDCDLKIHFI